MASSCHRDVWEDSCDDHRVSEACCGGRRHVSEACCSGRRRASGDFCGGRRRVLVEGTASSCDDRHRGVWEDACNRDHHGREDSSCDGEEESMCKAGTSPTPTSPQFP